MPVITLTTDWGTTDYYSGALKGEILSSCENATVVDISHHITKHDQVHGAFVLKNSWASFPSGTVHLASVTGAGATQPKLIAISYREHYFLGPDDGFFSLVFDEEPPQRYFVRNAKGEKVKPTSPILATSAAFLAKGGNIADMGNLMEDFPRKSMLRAVIDENTIKGSVIYIDSFGNVVTNITLDLFNRIASDRDFEIVLKKSGYEINEISNNYYDAGAGNLLALYNDAGYLEIAISKGSASELLNLKYGEVIRIDFK